MLIDEINVFWDNRDWKKFDKMAQNFFRYQRHFKATIICFSQTFDMDSKIRSLADELWISKKFFHYFNVCKKVNKFIYIVPPDKGESNITEAYELTHFWQLGCRMYTFLKRYWKYYDSFTIYELPTYDEFYKKEKFLGAD